MILGIYCAGGLGREILDLAQSINAAKRIWDNIIFIDDITEKTKVNGTDVYNFDKFKSSFSPNSAKIAIASGEPQARHTLFDRVAADGYRLQTLIHPSACIGLETQIEDGAIIQYGCLVSCNVTIKANAIVQSLSYIGHDSSICNDTVLGAHVAIAGNCRIGERTYIGVHVSVRERVSVGNDIIIGMGSVVTRNIPDGVVAYGSPAGIVRNSEKSYVFS